MAPPLPSRVMLFIPTRIGANRFILMDVVQQQTPLAWSLTAVGTYTFGIKMIMPEVATPTHMGTYVLRNCDGILLNKQIKMYPGISIMNAANEMILVISIAMHTTVFGSHKLKSNVVFEPMGALVPPTPAPAGDQVVHVPDAAIYVKKKKPVAPVQGQGGLEKFVAKQLLDLAILRKEMCPITAEEFSVGHTAAMPCGHLFMQFAIEESFKTKRDECPWCRQAGKPTYV
jgi:hypothetical protein